MEHSRLRCECWCGHILLLLWRLLLSVEDIGRRHEGSVRWLELLLLHRLLLWLLGCQHLLLLRLDRLRRRLLLDKDLVAEGGLWLHELEHLVALRCSK